MKNAAANSAPKPDRQTHAHRLPPKPLKKNGLHSVTESSQASSKQAPYSDCTPQPADRLRAADAKLRATKATVVPTETPIRNSTMRGAAYACPELSNRSNRHGAMDAFALPSRTGFTDDKSRKD